MNIANLTATIIIDLVSLTTISIFAVYHSLRFHLRTDHPSKNKWFNLKNVSFLIIFSSIVPRLISSLVYIPAYYSSNHYLNDRSCVYVIITYLCIGGINKFGIHLFVVLRSSISQTQAKSVWYKIGLLMVFSDALFIFYPLSGIPRVRADYVNGSCIPDIDMSIPLWFAASDFIIGIYCLIVFIVPLRKYIKLEEAQRGIDDCNSLCSIAKKVMMWSSIMLITTMFSVIIAIIYPPSNHYVFPLDKTLNTICVVMQFSKVDLTKISSKYVCFVSWMQCQCNDVKDIQNMDMMKLTRVTIDGVNPSSNNDVSSITGFSSITVSTQNGEESKTQSTKKISMPSTVEMQKASSLSFKKQKNLVKPLVKSASYPIGPIPQCDLVLV